MACRIVIRKDCGKPQPWSMYCKKHPQSRFLYATHKEAIMGSDRHQVNAHIPLSESVE